MRKLLPAILLLAACATVPPQQPGHFRILQLNDVYKIEGLEGGASGGLARVRFVRQLLESDGTPVLVLHAGDLLYPSVASKYLDAKQMIDVLNRLDGDANADDPHLVVTFGNHELDKGDATVLLQRLAESKFTWVASNTKYCPTPACDARFPGVTDVMLADVGGVKVGIFGILTPTQKPYATTTDRLQAATGAVAALRGQGARVVIAITHQDMPDDVEMVQKIAGIDLVVGGHDHLYQQQYANGVWIGKGDADAKSILVWDVVVPAAARVQTVPVRMVLDAAIPKDKAVDEQVRSWMAQLGEKLGGNETLATTQYLLEGVEPAVRGRETALGNLLTDVAREQMQTDVALLNGGSIRINDNIPPGAVTKYDMEGIFYYTNTLVAFPLTGAQLLDMLRNSVSRVDAGDGRFLQVSGITFAYSGAPGSWTVDAKDVKVNGQ
ncbi:MAG TPA: 5'-nucleotidase C-terminal domain-containing protein, partial [Thermoanaerobaculia bacterium]